MRLKFSALRTSVSNVLVSPIDSTRDYNQA